jgi:hypothetical protein
LFTDLRANEPDGKQTRFLTGKATRDIRGFQSGTGAGGTSAVGHALHSPRKLGLSLWKRQSFIFVPSPAE